MREEHNDVTELLRSFIAGRWVAGTGEGDRVLDASTGEEVARVSSAGLDLAEMVQYARRCGPAIAELTFHERALLLKEVATRLTADTEELYELSFRTGATRRDSAVDIDGGFGTLFSLSSKGRRELPNDTVHLDGDLERLGREGRFLGQHIYTTRPGVAVQINAFNFPVWGMLEKLGPAFLAGLPSIVKPASQTAYLTAAAVSKIISYDILPAGALQLLCGSPGGLLDELGPQDSVAFTGSAHTANILRQHPSVVNSGVRLGVEADSLNCSVLGPDISSDDPEFDLFVKSVVTEMTVKAGQKCTAIRRVIVPDSQVDAAVDAITARLSKITVGHPAADDVRMGPLASLGQRAEVRKAIEALRSSCDIVYGDPDRVSLHGAEVDADHGAFISPVLLCAHPGAVEPHDVEPFGPVSTMISYSTIGDAVQLAARGRGSLVGSVITNDPGVARDLTLGLAPWHGRLLVLNREDAAESTGHGSPLPMLVHGGPGRAGGGEELGGVRGVLAHMQRTAIQASPNMLTAITGRWATGSQRRVSEVHPFRKSLTELRIGDTVSSPGRTVTRSDIDHFADFTGDTFYAHTDPEAAANNPFFGGLVAHGYLVVSLAAGLFVDPAPGPVRANFGIDRLRFLTPVKPQDSIRVDLTVKQITPRATADYGEVRWDAEVLNQRDEIVASYDVLTLVAKES